MWVYGYFKDDGVGAVGVDEVFFDGRAGDGRVVAV